MKAGDTVYVVDLDQRRGTDRTPKEDTVATVGRKYFTLKKYWRWKFDLQTGYHVSDTTAHYRVYTSMKAYQDEKRRQRLWDEIYGKLRMSYIDTFSLETLEGIAKLIGIDDERK